MGLTRTPCPPSLCSSVSGRLGPPPPTPWRWSRDRWGAESSSQGSSPLSYLRVLLMENLSVAWPCSVGVGGSRCSAPPPECWRATYLSLQAPFHSIRPQGLLDSDQRFCPALVGDLGVVVGRGQGIGSEKLASRASGWGYRDCDSHPGGRSLSKHVLSPAYPGSRTPVHVHWLVTCRTQRAREELGWSWSGDGAPEDR